MTYSIDFTTASRDQIDRALFERLETYLSTLLPVPAIRPVERVALGRERRRARPLNASATPATAWQWVEDESAND